MQIMFPSKEGKGDFLKSSEQKNRVFILHMDQNIIWDPLPTKY